MQSRSTWTRSSSRFRSESIRDCKLKIAWRHLGHNAKLGSSFRVSGFSFSVFRSVAQLLVRLLLRIVIGPAAAGLFSTCKR